MTQAADTETAASDQEQTKPNRKKRWTPQISLLSILLIITAFATWSSYLKTKRDLEEASQQVLSLRTIARELAIGDPKKFTAVEQFPNWNDENCWLVYVPPEVSAVVCFATEKIDGNSFVAPEKSIPISSGRHEIAIRHQDSPEGDRDVIRVWLDGEVVIQDDKPADWEGNGATSSSGNLELSVDQPFRLLRRQFSYDNQTTQAGSEENGGPGILLWIQDESLATEESI